MIFDPFGNFETAGYLQNSLCLKDPTEVKESEHLAFEASLEDALSFLKSCEQIDYACVLKVHEILFSGFYPWAGQDRNQLVPHLAVFKGTEDSPHHTAFEHPARIKIAVEYALKLASNAARFKQKPGEVMGQLAFAHPFLDGNGRSLLLVFMELAFRAGFAIDWSRTRKSEYLQALSKEINVPGKGYLDEYFYSYQVDITLRDEWPTIIGNIQGLDGMDNEGVIYESLDDPEIQKIYNSYNARHYDSHG